MKTLTIHHNGFHGAVTARCKIPMDSEAGDIVPLSSRQARRLNGLCCGVADCCCGEHIAEEQSSGEYFLALPINFNGNKIEIGVRT